MKIVLKDVVTVGDLEIPPGEYMVALHSETRQVNLAGGGMDYKVPAIKRPSKKPCRTTDIQFYPAGGKTWSLIVRTPKHGEWLSTLTYGSRKKR